MLSPNLSAAILPAPRAPAQNTRCRPIEQADLEPLAGLFAEGFARMTREAWTMGFARMVALPRIEGLPRFGYLLESGGRPVGALLLISSARGPRIVANISSWYVDPAFRSYSPLLVGVATKLPHVTYINISPAPHTWRVIEAQGFARYNDGRSAVATIFAAGGGHVSETVPGNLRERELLLAHRGYGCMSVVCEKDGVVLPFVLRPRRLRRLPVRMMELIYCRRTEDFMDNAGALGRFLLRRGFVGVLCDGKIPLPAVHYVPGKEPRYFKGPRPALNDLAFTEKVIFGT